jgi:hypothetical protein
MKPKAILTTVSIILAIGGFTKLSVDNTRLKKEVANLHQHLNDDSSEARTISLTYREVTGPFDEGTPNQQPLILDSAEAERLLKGLESEKGFQVSTFPEISVPSGQDATFELSDLMVRATPVVGADGFTIDLSTSAALNGQDAPSSAKNILWTGQTVVMPSPRSPNSLLFLKADIEL